MVSSNNFAENLHGIYFAALKGSSYHSLRMNFLDLCHRLTMFIVIIMSSSSLMYVVVWLLGFIDVDPKSVNLMALFSLTTLFVGTIDLVFSWTVQARRHDTLSNRWGDLIRRIDDRRSEGRGISEEDYTLFVRDHNSIIKDEPLIYMGLDAAAYNFVSRSHGYTKMLIIPRRVRWFKNWFKFSDNRFALIDVPEPKVIKKQKKSDSKGK